MTRSEEQVRVGTQTQESGQARLRKYVVTENVTETVPVRKEKAVLETEPVTSDNYGAATSVRTSLKRSTRSLSARNGRWWRRPLSPLSASG